MAYQWPQHTLVTIPCPTATSGRKLCTWLKPPATILMISWPRKDVGKSGLLLKGPKPWSYCAWDKVWGWHPGHHGFHQLPGIGGQLPDSVSTATWSVRCTEPPWGWHSCIMCSIYSMQTASWGCTKHRWGLSWNTLFSPGLVLPNIISHCWRECRATHLWCQQPSPPATTWVLVATAVTSTATMSPEGRPSLYAQQSWALVKVPSQFPTRSMSNMHLTW